MVRTLILIFIAIPLLFSCYHENKVEVQKPEVIIEPQVMVDILTDVQVAESIISRNRVASEKTQESYKDSLYQVIFDHYNITASQLRQNIAWYNNEPAEMEDIYEEILAKLSKIQSEILIDTIPQSTTDTVNDTVAEKGG